MKFYFDLYVHFFTLRSMAFKLECIFDSHECHFAYLFSRNFEYVSILQVITAGLIVQNKKVFRCQRQFSHSRNQNIWSTFRKGKFYFLFSLLNNIDPCIVGQDSYLNISSRTIHWILTKLNMNESWVVPFKKNQMNLVGIGHAARKRVSKLQFFIIFQF